MNISIFLYACHAIYFSIILFVYVTLHRWLLRHIYRLSENILWVRHSFLHFFCMRFRHLKTFINWLFLTETEEKDSTLNLGNNEKSCLNIQWLKHYRESRNRNIERHLSLITSEYYLFVSVTIKPICVLFNCHGK